MNVERNFRLRVHVREISGIPLMDPDDTTVDFTIPIGAIAAPFSLPGPICRPFQGRTETQGWSFEIIDSANVITSELADAGGRLHLLGRLVQVQMQEDGGAWSTVGTARLANLSQTQGPGRYTLSLEDERWKERNSTIFTRSDTTSLWPQGLRFPFRRYPAIGTFTCRVGFAVLNTVWLQPINDDGFVASNVLPDTAKVTRAIEDLIVSDVKVERGFSSSATVGNFDTVRVHCDGVEREILSFSTTRLIVQAPGQGTLSAVTDPDEEDRFLMPFWVVWLDTLPSEGDEIEVTITAAEHEPDPALPYHVGVADGSHEWGSATGHLHPFDALERAYIEAGVRYDPAAMATLQADTRYDKSAWRITKKHKTADWAEEAIYQPNIVVPFIDNEGRVAPRAVHLPSNIDPVTLFVFDASNTKAPHVTWHHGVREVVNIVNVEYGEERYFDGEMPDDEPLPTDRIAVTPRTIPHEHDTIDELGPKPLTVRMDGLHRGIGRGLVGAIEDMFSPPNAQVRDHAERFKTDIFEVAGDGPQSGTIHGMLSTSSVAAGDLVVLDQDEIQNPNPAENARGGSRIVRILQRTFHIDGYEFEYLDVGAALQPLAEPTIAIALNADDPAHAVDITVSDVPAGASVTVFLGTDDGFADLVRQLVDVGAGVHPVHGLPAGTEIFAAGYSHAPGRTRSLLSSPVSVTTDADAPIVRDTFTLTLPGVGSVLATGTVNAVTLGVELAYEAHAAEDEPGLSSTVDVAVVAGAFSHEFAASLVTDEAFSVGATPYPAFPLSGTPGEQVVRSIATPQPGDAIGPHLLGAPSLAIVAGDLVVTWSHLAHSTDAGGIRIFFIAHDSTERPPFGGWVDKDIDDGSHTFDSSLLTGKFFSILVEVWSGFSGGQIAGIPGSVRIGTLTIEVAGYIFIGDVGVIPEAMLEDGSVTEPKIDDAAVIRRTINDRAIGALQLDENVVSIQHLVVGSFDNLASNPGFESGSVDPHLFTDAGGSWVVNNSLPRSGVFVASYVTTSQTGTAAISINGPANDPALHHAASVGDRFYAEAWCRCSTGTGNDVSVTLLFRDAAGAALTGGTTTGAVVTPSTTYQRASHSATAPAGTAFVAAQVNVENDGRAPSIRIDDLYMRRMVEGSIVVDGTILAQHIAALTITAAQIAADAITATKIAAGAVTTAKLDALAVTAEKIAADAVTAAKVAAMEIVAGKYIRSANYSAGSAGWNINDTEAEFNDVTIRGTLDAGVIVSEGVLGTMVHDHSNTNPGGTTGTSEEDLMSRTLPTLLDGDMIDFVAMGTVVDGSATKTLRVRLSGVQIASITLPGTGHTRWSFRGHLIKDVSSTWIHIDSKAAAGAVLVGASGVSAELSGAILKVTGQTANAAQNVFGGAFVTTATNKRP